MWTGCTTTSSREFHLVCLSMAIMTGMAEDAAIRARLLNLGMGVLTPAAGTQALAATLTMSRSAIAVLSAAPIWWDVFLHGKKIVLFFAEVAQIKSSAAIASKVVSSSCNPQASMHSAIQSQVQLPQVSYTIQPCFYL